MQEKQLVLETVNKGFGIGEMVLGGLTLIKSLGEFANFSILSSLIWGGLSYLLIKDGSRRTFGD